MAERIDFRQPTQEADTPIIGAFGGLSSASYTTTGNVTNAQKLTNAYVNKRNEITRRQGSSIVGSVQSLTTANASLLCSHSFSFDNRNYVLVREGYNLRLLTLEGGAVVDVKTKNLIFNTLDVVERTNFTTVVEDNNCYVICTQRNTLPVVFVILKRDVFISSKTNNNNFTLSTNNYPTGDIVTQDNLLLYNSANVYVPITTASQSSFTVTISSATPVLEPANTSVRIHMVFACLGVSAAYYPGTYLYNTAVRKNLVGLDVNVQIPTELVSNPLITEPVIQDLSINTLQAYKTNGNPATAYNRVFTRQPTNVDDYEFSDGSYRIDPTIFTVRTPSFIGFGALQSPTTDTKVYMFRMRSTGVLMPNYALLKSRFSLYIDKVLNTVTTYSQTGAITTDDSVGTYYYSLGKSASPGINLSAVVELFYRNFGAANPIVDLTQNQPSVVINDFYLFPFYGLSAVSDVGGNLFPSICQTVGNRVVLTGFTNKIAVSNSDWDYRGISWNNFQVSTINFSETSAYLVSLTQSTSVVKAVSSVNGVIFVGTDSGIYRISGTNANVPPNAQSLNVSRVSNEVVAGQSSMAIYSNRVFYVSKNGLYSLEYNRDNEEINATPLSAEVSDYFFSFTPSTITYSDYYRGFLISFVETSTILVYLLETETYCVFRVASNAVVRATPMLDGYQATINTTTAGINHVLFCKWDNSSTDVSNALSALPPNSLMSFNTQVFTENNQVNTLVTPAELLDTLNAGLRQSYGKENARAVAGNITIAEGATTNNPTPIISSFVSKGFSSQKLVAANRVRAVNLLLAGSGVAVVKVVYQTQDYNDRVPDIRLVSIDAAVGYQGEGLLNYQYAEQSSVGDNTNVRLRVSGVGEAWELAVSWNGDIKMLGYQFDTSSKKRGRLR